MFADDAQGVPKVLAYDSRLAFYWIHTGEFGQVTGNLLNTAVNRWDKGALLTLMARITPQQRSFLWERAVNEYNYMIHTCKPKMPIMPEIFLKRGEALLRLNKVFDAEESFKRAWELKADYWEAYAAWADKLVEMKLYDRAREIIENGLAKAPQAAPLQERMQRISAIADKTTSATKPRSRSASSPGG